MVAPNYAKHRSSLAKKIGLGTKPRVARPRRKARLTARPRQDWPRAPRAGTMVPGRGAVAGATAVPGC